jgi:hypothetical protein
MEEPSRRIKDVTVITDFVISDVEFCDKFEVSIDGGKFEQKYLQL